MHLDVTPMDPATEPRPERVGDIYHSRNGEADKRLPVNPYGFAGWFRGQLVPASQAFIDNARAMRARLEIRDRLVSGLIVADADIDDLPDLIDPIRDAPQVIALKLMKRYLNLRYANRDMKRPVSVYLSKIAVLVGPSPFGLCGQLVTYAKELDRRMTVALETGRRPDERNPVFSMESFNDRWPKDAMEMRVFREDLRYLVKELERARQSELTEIRKIFDESLRRDRQRSGRSGLHGRRDRKSGPDALRAWQGLCRRACDPGSGVGGRRPHLSGAVSPFPLRPSAVKMIRRVKPRSWGAQVDRMRMRWPEMRHVDVAAKNTVAWIGPLRGFQMSYRVQIQWSWAADRAFPHVFILEPALRPRDGERLHRHTSSHLQRRSDPSSLRFACSTPQQASGTVPCGSRTRRCHGRRNGFTTTNSGMSMASGAAPTRPVRYPSGQASDPKRS